MDSNRDSVWLHHFGCALDERVETNTLDTEDERQTLVFALEVS